jgi:hydrogenase expression/formation protein HypD
MTLKHMDEYRNAEISQGFVKKIKRRSQKEIRLMEVCGTHTVAIFRNGIRALLPETVSLLSGPGCPVCVTAQTEIDTFIKLAEMDDVIVTTFGDLMRVPGTHSSLQKQKGEGCDIRMVYSAYDALEIAKKNPHKKVVFLGVGFETTAPTIAASILSANQMNMKNFSVCCAHKTVPRALDTLMNVRGVKIDGFILPGHVSVIIGTNAYRPLFNTYQIPSVVAGFEPVDLLQAIAMLVTQIEDNAPELANGYIRAVTPQGNLKAQAIMASVFQPVDAAWRGIGIIPDSGLKIREEYAVFDAENNFDLKIPTSPEPKGCACGEILTGLKIPPQCPLYKTTCTPMDPVGPCMVSSEGTCAAYYRYHTENNTGTGKDFQ